MLVAELARRVGRTPDTIKRWTDEGLLNCERDDRNRRIFREEHVEMCLQLVRLSVTAQLQNRKLSELVEGLPQQMSLLELQAS
jgi:DNA-binding transcriptional MerR regulator